MAQWWVEQRQRPNGMAFHLVTIRDGGLDITYE